ncbi:MAG: lipopolysaccharide biosynthesis protein [Candidatus Dormibacteraeota bacterium]|nr:lipopolysaccharide biosynthesis protein [Candidatus Dormibacteraeota bacterium]
MAVEDAQAGRDRLSRRRDYLTTFAAETLFILSYLAVFRLVADHFGPRGFGEYALSRRTLAFLLPIGAIGLDIAVARFVAYAADRPEEQRAYLPAALGLLAIATGVLSIVLVALQGFWSDLFFGSAHYVGLVPPLALMVAGNGLFAVAYGNFRGHLQILRANVLRVVVHVLLPFAAALLVRGSVSDLLYVVGGGWAVLSLAALAVTRMSIRDPLAHAAELARYSLPRAPGDLLALVMFAVPGIVVAHVSDISVAGNVAFGIAALGMVAVAVFPVGFVLLPVASRLLAAGSVDRLRGQVFIVARVVVVLIVIAIAVFELFANQLVSVYLGPAFAGSVATLRVLMLGALPWGIYMSLRTVIDARHKRAVNAINVAVAFAFFVALMVILSTWMGAATVVVPVFVTSLYLLGSLTVIEVWRITHRPLPLPSVEAEADAAADSAAEPIL